MSDFKVEVVEIDYVFTHNNSDHLEFTILEGGHVAIFGNGEYVEGDLAVCIPTGAVVPDEPQYAFLKGKRRIRPKKIRGLVSECLLMDLPDELLNEDPDNIIGLDLQDWLHIEEYKPPHKGPTLPTRKRRHRPKSLFYKLKRALKNLLRWAGVLEAPSPSPITIADPNTTSYALSS